MLTKVLQVCDTPRNFEGFEECAKFYKEVINIFKQMNYSEYKSESFYNYIEQIDKYTRNDN